MRLYEIMDGIKIGATVSCRPNLESSVSIPLPALLLPLPLHPSLLHPIQANCLRRDQFLLLPRPLPRLRILLPLPRHPRPRPHRQFPIPGLLPIRCPPPQSILRPALPLRRVLHPRAECLRPACVRADPLCQSSSRQWRRGCAGGNPSPQESTCQ